MSVVHTLTYCNAMHCNALQCNALQCTAMHCSALQCTAMHCNALQCTAIHGNARQCTALHCNAMQYTAIHGNALQRCNALALQHTAAQGSHLAHVPVMRTASRCNTLQHIATHYDTLLLYCCSCNDTCHYTHMIHTDNQHAARVHGHSTGLHEIFRMHSPYIHYAIGHVHIQSAVRVYMYSRCILYTSPHVFQNAARAHMYSPYIHVCTYLFRMQHMYACVSSI